LRYSNSVIQPSRVFILAVALQTKFPLSRKTWSRAISFRPRCRGMPLTNTYYTAAHGVSVPLLRRLCACHESQSKPICRVCSIRTEMCLHFFQDFLFFTISPFFYIVHVNCYGSYTTFDKCAICFVLFPLLCMHSAYEKDEQSQLSQQGCHSWLLEDQPFSFCRRCGTASIFSTGSSNMYSIHFLLRATECDRNIALRRPRVGIMFLWQSVRAARKQW